MKTIEEIINPDVACEEGYEWYQSQPDFKTAWETCHRGDWMIWFARKLRVNKRLLILIGGYCVETVIPLMKNEISVAAVKATIAYGLGNIKLKQLKEMTSAANIALINAKEAYASCNSSYIEACDIYSAYAATAAAFLAATNFDVAVSAATDAITYAVTALTGCYTDIEKIAYQKKTADICRRYLTKAVFEKLNIKP